jgi:hypothetical protein
LVVSTLELDTFSAVGLLYGGRQLWWNGWFINVSADL